MDLDDARQVDKREASSLAEEWQVEYFETSASAGTNIEKVW